MLAASPSVLEQSEVAMGVSQEQDSFAVPSQNLQSVYFTVSVPGRLTRHDSSSSEEAMPERNGINYSSSSSNTSPVSFQECSADRGENADSSDAPNSQGSVGTGARAKYGTRIIGLESSSLSLTEDTDNLEQKKKKKKKWRPVGAEEMGFRLTLFPRVSEPASDEMSWDQEFCYQGAASSAGWDRHVTEPDQYVALKAPHFAHLQRLEGSGLTRKETVLRKDRWREQRVKVRKQLKSKDFCLTSLRSLHVGCTLYIHFRLFKLHCARQELGGDLCLQHPNLPSLPKMTGVCMDVARSAVKAQVRSVKAYLSSSSTGRSAPPPQNLTHALDNNNAATELPTDIISFLISIQHREMTPEDYEMLLRLDESVAPKTVDQSHINSFRTDVVDESTAGEGMCSVCMDSFEVGQERKFLPCEHVFHSQCIDMWLANSSQNCPLDGLPVS